MAAFSNDQASPLDPTNDPHDTLCPALPPPQKSLQLYRRIAFGRKHLFTPSSSEEAQYFLQNPVPHKHANTWKPVFYRGDNPKYTPTSKAIARIRRTGMWNSFQIELGDGIEEVLENKRRVKERKSYERKQRTRKRFRMKEKPPKKELEDEKDVNGFVMALSVRRVGFLKRTLKWELGGEEYRWKGTRTFLPSGVRRWKGISHDMKLVDSNKRVLATVEKDRWAFVRPSERTGVPPNKKKSLVGTLRIYPAAYAEAASETDQLKQGSGTTIVANQEAPHCWNMGEVGKESQNLNAGGSHSGNITEEAIVLTCWIAVEAEHRLRHKIFDLLEEIAEEFQE
ncbi:hypothetical protein BGZ61DRAFT_355786 [Ilyonectria robusta]|uniref:uncharacterized protein n=1 Tax=Ilyonectria robusta TaxID=1079257 RepID=UPI001E8DB0EC|nr:uncharacterized protein BGZ61DRAFT_355786 [Ilyonectria robusta]KAH8686490.1 hypothetical protein BGZ61DRAFT_355786 [Ilyonectria robusta]